MTEYPELNQRQKVELAVALVRSVLTSAAYKRPPGFTRFASVNLVAALRESRVRFESGLASLEKAEDLYRAYSRLRASDEVRT